MSEFTDAGNRRGVSKNSIYLVFGEGLFVIVPVIIVILYVSQGELRIILKSHEWALAATILFGQSIMKLVAGTSSHSNGIIYQRSALLAAVIILCGLLPSAILMTSLIDNSAPPIAILICQFVWLVLGILCFVLVGTVGQTLIDNAKLENLD